MSDFKALSFVDQCRQAQKSFQKEVLFTWAKADIMSQPDTPDNEFVKELIRQNEDLERRLLAEQVEHRHVLSSIESLAAGRGKFG